MKMSQTAIRRRASKEDFSFECIRFFGEAAQVFGISSSVGQIYGLLFASHEPLSYSDIFERLEISKGSASQGLKLLRSLGAVKVDSVGTGHRREYFIPELSLRRLLRGVLDGRISPLSRESLGALARLHELAGHAGAEEQLFRMERVKQLEAWRRKLKMVVPVLGTILGRKE